MPSELSPDYSDGDSGDELGPRCYDKRRPAHVICADSPRPDRGGPREAVEMKPLSFDGRGSVRTFLAKFDNCALVTGRRMRDFIYLNNCREDPAVQVLWDLLPVNSFTFNDLGMTLEAVYGSVFQAEVYW